MGVAFNCYVCYNEGVQIRYIGGAFRLKHRVGLRPLARGAGVSVNTIRAWEKGDSKPNVATVERIATYFEALGIPCRLNDLLEETPDVAPP